MNMGEKNMKKIIMVVVLFLAFTGVATGSSLNGDYKGNPIVLLKLNGRQVSNFDVPPMIIDGSTMVPISLLRQIGLTVNWDSNTYSVDVGLPDNSNNLNTSSSSQPNTNDTNSTDGRTKLTAKDIAKLMDRVGTIITYDQYGRPIAQGSGFVIDHWGLVITNSHVMQNASSWDIKLNASTYHHNWWWYNNPNTDVFGTYINVDRTGKVPSDSNFPFIPSNTNLPSIGDKVYAIGSPDGLTNTISEGIVSGIRNQNGMTIIQHTAFTDHGSSGGVLLNEYGEAIGITYAGIEKTPLDFAIPMLYVQAEINKKKQ